MTIDGQVMGRVGTTRIGPELDALPAMSDVRYHAVRAHINADYQRAYDAIVAACPEAFHGVRSMGSIELVAS